MICLTALLGGKAYSVARHQLQDTRDLVAYDLKAQTLLTRMESMAVSRDQAQRKFRMTQDRVYSDLVSYYDAALKSSAGSLSQVIAPAYPELAGDTEALKASAQLHPIQAMRSSLELKRENKMNRAHESSEGMVRLIISSFLLCIGVTGWLLFLFYNGLLEPLRALREATGKLRQGDLSHRVSMRSGFTHGVSELADLSESFNRMAEKLESLDQAKTEFLETLSHEIKNPLAALKEGLNLLSRKDANLSEASRQRGFNACLIASKRVETMINNLLSVASAEKNLFDFEKAQKNFPLAVQTAMDEVRPLAEKKGIQLQLKAAPNVMVLFNWDAMVQVFENLLLNAIKYGQENSVVDVEVSADATGEKIICTVSNVGSGFSDQETTHVFDRFYRASNSSKQKGLGIGLHVVKKIIEAHEGEVSASSSAGKTSLQFSLPAGAGGLVGIPGLSSVHLSQMENL